MLPHCPWLKWREEGGGGFVVIVVFPSLSPLLSKVMWRVCCCFLSSGVLYRLSTCPGMSKGRRGDSKGWYRVFLHGPVSGHLMNLLLCLESRFLRVRRPKSPVSSPNLSRRISLSGSLDVFQGGSWVVSWLVPTHTSRSPIPSLTGLPSLSSRVKSESWPPPDRIGRVYPLSIKYSGTCLICRPRTEWPPLVNGIWPVARLGWSGVF